MLDVEVGGNKTFRNIGVYLSTLCNIPEELKHQKHCCDNLKCPKTYSIICGVSWETVLIITPPKYELRPYVSIFISTYPIIRRYHLSDPQRLELKNFKRTNKLLNNYMEI